MPELALKVLLSYVLGSVIGALWVGRALGRVDIRTLGSGNAGGTNALRTQGWLFAFLVVVIDVGKGVLAAGWVSDISIPGLASESVVGQAWLQIACASAAVVGHVFPLFHGFKGGKGAATLAGALLVVSWQALLVLMAAWLVCTTLTGFVGLATILATMSAAAYAGTTLGTRSPLFVFSMCMTIFIVFTHRSNIARMINGIENRTVRLMIFRPKPDREKPDD